MYSNNDTYFKLHKIKDNHEKGIKDGTCNVTRKKQTKMQSKRKRTPYRINLGCFLQKEYPDKSETLPPEYFH
jgi:hypothetical protein